MPVAGLVTPLKFLVRARSRVAAPPMRFMYVYARTLGPIGPVGPVAPVGPVGPIWFQSSVFS